MDSDFIKGINKSIDAASGKTGGDYNYKYHTDVTDALDKLADVISSGGSGGGGSSTLAGLTDVSIVTPSADQVLKYDGDEWVNETIDIPTANGKIETFTGTPTSTLSNGSCTISKVTFSDFKIIDIYGWFKADGTINTATQYTPLFTFNDGVIEEFMDYILLAYGYDSQFRFCRVSGNPSTNTIDSFYGTTADTYYDFHQTYAIKS